jgi:hypothetical protein
MRTSYFPKNGVWLKGNTHGHSTVSDGRFTPEELVRGYRERGYSFLALTDHNVLAAHDDLSDEKFILLTGLEHDIEYSAGKCTHVTGLSAAEKTATNYLCRRYSSREKSDQQLIHMMCGDGQFVSLAHPVWSRMSWEEILSLEGYQGFEVYNNGTEHLCHGGNAEVLWDMLLRAGKKVFAMAVDDQHVAEDLYGGWIWLKAAERSKQAILDALWAGSFYASNGPDIVDFALDAETGEVYVACSPCREIHFVTYEPRGKSIFAKEGETITEASFHLRGTESYIRVVCVDQEGHSAWSNPIFFDERAEK